MNLGIILILIGIIGIEILICYAAFINGGVIPMLIALFVIFIIDGLFILPDG